MSLNGIFPDWMLPTSVGDAVSQVVNQGDLVLVDTGVSLEVSGDTVELVVQDDSVVVTIDDAVTVVPVEESPPTVTLGEDDIIVEGCE